MTDAFARRLLAWWDRHGRQGLPWQRPRTPYRVWVSEVMLQQTQVATVIPYFERFMARFPALPDLAAAEDDAVLALWSGLGYYSRARNLHAAARQVAAEHGGTLPQELEALMALPGIGRSTAGAILAQAFGRRHPILDGNAKRVLARYHAVGGWPGRSAVQARLWQLADAHTPHQRVADYTQAIMDLGATLCRRGAPQCERCPLVIGCEARRAGSERHYPEPKPKRVLPVRATAMLVIEDGAGRILLERRPPSGVWGGLWSLPQCDPAEAPVAHCRERFGVAVDAVGAALPEVRHTFSHFRLDIRPVRLRAVAGAGGVAEGTARWFDGKALAGVGLPAPVRTIVNALLAG